MNKNSRIIIAVLAVLMVTTAISAALNRQYSQDKQDLLKAAEIVVMDNGNAVSRLNLATITELPVAEFKAWLKSSVMLSPEEHTYTGVAFADLFRAGSISLADKSRVVVRSVDGYAVPISIAEIQTLDNVYLVYKDNGEFLRSYGEANGQGPYMIVIRGDRFSQRWAKYVCELDVQ